MSLITNSYAKKSASYAAGFLYNTLQKVTCRIKYVLDDSISEIPKTVDFGFKTVKKPKPQLMPDVFVHGDKVIYGGTRKKAYVKPEAHLLSEERSKEILHNEKQKELDNVFRFNWEFYNPKTDKSIIASQNGVCILKGKHRHTYDFENRRELPYEMDIRWKDDYTLITDKSGKQKVYDKAGFIKPETYFLHRDVPYYYAEVQGYSVNPETKHLMKIFPSLKDRIVWERRGY